MSRKIDETEAAFEARTRRAFTDSVERVDGATRSKLAQARARAVEAKTRRGAFAWPSMARLMPGGALAAALLAAVVVWQLSPPRPEPALAALSDLDILLGDEELELFEDLEFYTWLQEQPELQESIDADDGAG
jgi:hypothetical protein